MLAWRKIGKCTWSLSSVNSRRARRVCRITLLPGVESTTMRFHESGALLYRCLNRCAQRAKHHSHPKMSAVLSYLVVTAMGSSKRFTVNACEIWSTSNISSMSPRRRCFAESSNWFKKNMISYTNATLFRVLWSAALHRKQSNTPVKVQRCHQSQSLRDNGASMLLLNSI